MTLGGLRYERLWQRSPVGRLGVNMVASPFFGRPSPPTPATIHEGGAVRVKSQAITNDFDRSPVARRGFDWKPFSHAQMPTTTEGEKP